MKRKENSAVYLAMAALSVSVAACVLDYQAEYNVLGKVAETETVSETESITEAATETKEEAKETTAEKETKKDAETEAGTEEVQTETPESESEADVSTRPEYDPEQYADTSQCDVDALPEIKEINNVKISDEEAIAAIQDDMVIKGIYSDATTASKGDIINLTYTVKDKATGEILSDVEDEDCTVGSNLFPNDVDARFVGKKEEDTIDAVYTYPSSYEDSQYAGKTCAFHIVINELRGMQLTDDIVPALTDDAEQTVDGLLSYTKKLLAYKQQKTLALEAVGKLCEKVKLLSYPEDTLAYDYQKKVIQIYHDADVEDASLESLDEYATSVGYADAKELLTEIQGATRSSLEEEIKILALVKKYGLWLDDDALDRRLLQSVPDYSNPNDYYTDYSKYQARYLVAREDLAGKIVEVAKEGGG